MDVARKPVPIFLIELVLYPVVVLMFLNLSMEYGIKLAARYVDFPPHLMGTVIGGVYLLLKSLLLYVAIPFSCYRLWRSSDKYLVGVKNTMSKILAGAIFVTFVSSGLFMLASLPQLVEMFKLMWITQPA